MSAFNNSMSRLFRSGSKRSASPSGGHRNPAQASTDRSNRTLENKGNSYQTDSKPHILNIQNHSEPSFPFIQHSNTDSEIPLTQYMTDTASSTNVTDSVLTSSTVSLLATNEMESRKDLDDTSWRTTSKEEEVALTSPDSVCPASNNQVHLSQNVDIGAPEQPLRCFFCEREDPELVCFVCDSEGSPYHKLCWAYEHQSKHSRTHEQMLLRDLQRLRYLKRPNRQRCIDEKAFADDNENCFIEFNVKSQKFQFGPRASPLLRHRWDQHNPQYPSFVSFVGRTMNGKSFILRSLISENAPSLDFPSPIPAPGALERNHSSTSSDVNLYADWETSKTESPIHFLDCEGFEGNNRPASYLSKAKKLSASMFAADPTAEANSLVERRERIEFAYPRILYAFSTCVVYVTSGELAESAEIGRKLISYANRGAEGSQSQGFKPSLFVVFNRFRNGDTLGSKWSIQSSTKAFLADGEVSELKLFYESIYVIYIPTLRKDESSIGLKQLDAFRNCLHEEHRLAFLRRREFSLAFTPERLSALLWKALTVFSEEDNPVFDWSLQAVPFETSKLRAMLNDLWTQYAKYYSNQKSESPRSIYEEIRAAFQNHVEFCLHLHTSRDPPPGLHARDIAQFLGQPIEQVEELLSEHEPCAAKSPLGFMCRQTRLRHGDYHQGITTEAFYQRRWAGKYLGSEMPPSYTFQTTGVVKLESFPLGGFTKSVPAIRSVKTCFGCLQRPPSSFLACGHALCLNCLQNLANDSQTSHHINSVLCPFHRTTQSFSPRLLPSQAGYRVLSLDGGGVRGLAQLVVLGHIEKRCFGIPTTQLYDLIVGSSLGGQIALALTAPIPLTITKATEEFTKLLRDGFRTKGFRTKVFRKSKYEASHVERQLRTLFGTGASIHTPPAHDRQSVPNMAVTTVVELQGRPTGSLLANYNRNGVQHAYPLILTVDANEDMPIWAAARSASAAPPFFKGFQWQGQVLLDGGLQMRCPGSAAYLEAKSIWPEKKSGFLVSIGTGTDSEPSHNSRLDINQSIKEAEALWFDFAKSPPSETTLFRLNPTFPGAGFELDDSTRLAEIVDQTSRWLRSTQIQDMISDISDQLIAGLFFFRPKGRVEKVPTGEIVFRLPLMAKGCQAMVEAMKWNADNLFRIEYNGEVVDVDCGAVLRILLSNEELRFPVKLPRLPITDSVELEIKMRHVGASMETKWWHISGSPYMIDHWEQIFT